MVLKNNNHKQKETRRKQKQSTTNKITNHFDNNTELHQNWVDYDRKNTHFVADQNILIVVTDLRAMYPEIDLVYVIAFRILSHLPEEQKKIEF